MINKVTIFDDKLKSAFANRARAISYKPIHIVDEISESIKDRLSFFNKKFSAIEIEGMLGLSLDEFISSDELSVAAISILELQFINDVPQFLENIKNKVGKGGLVFLTFVGEGTFKNLREILEKLDQKVLNGISPKVAPMIAVKDAGMLMQRAGFKNVVADVHSININYQSLNSALQDIRSLGLSNCLRDRNSNFLGKKYLKELENEISIKGLNLNYDIITLTGFA